ncbi:MAG TPA: 7TM-DISM domain-containing protein [Cytophagaceae bacterium]|nr:7TM-DISM domain-containing protein [Cytophagaceae bacterium]
MALPNLMPGYRNIVSLVAATLLFYTLIPLSYAADPVLITDKDIDELHFWKLDNLEILEDADNELSIQDILSGRYDAAFQKGQLNGRVTKKNNVSYWGRIRIKKLTQDNNKWVFEAYDQSIDEIDFYAPDQNGHYVGYEEGDSKPFAVRPYKHKNFVFDLNLEYNKEQTVYIRIKSSHPVFFIGVVRNIHAFISYALKEYFFLALFYGLTISMIILNLMQYLITRLNIYLVYVFYVFAALIYISSQDGLGFEFLWFGLPGINNIISSLFSFLMIGLALLLAYEFLRDTNPDKKYLKWGLGLLGIRFLYLVITLAGVDLFPAFMLDLPIRFYILYLSLMALSKGHRQLRYFTIAMATLVIGYTVRELTVSGLLPHTIATVYMHLFGESFQMIFISMAMGEQIKIRMEDLVLSQEKSLAELESTHINTEKLRKDLQARVEEQISRDKYVSAGISELSNIISSYLNDNNQLYKKITKFMAEYFECRLAALYLVPPGKNYLQLVSGYGLDDIRLTNTAIEEGDGLLGQCLKDKERIEIRELPEDYISISSGLGQAIPKVVIIEPLHFNQQLVGVIEMASFKEFTPLQYEVLNKFVAQIASTLSNVLFNETTRKMLDESRTKEEMLRQQEEEMRQQVEELMATQDEFARKEQQYRQEIEELKKK